MILQTRYFGELDVKESEIIDFSHGLPGFDTVKRYILINNEEENSPFKWLQSIDDRMLAFVLINPFAVKKNYEIKLDDETLSELGIINEKDVEVYSIVVVPEDMNKMTMNLQAPLVINSRSKRGKQLILDTDRYGVRHYVLEELQGREETVNACADEEKGPINHNK